MLLCYSANIALKGQTRKRVGHTSVCRGSKRFFFGKSSFSPSLRAGALVQAGYEACEKNRTRKNFSSANFSRRFHQLAQTRPIGPANKFVHQGLRGVSLERNHLYIYLKSQYFIFFLFLKALDEQEVALKQQIVHLEKQVKESTPDKAKLKELQDAVKKHEKGKKY